MNRTSKEPRHHTYPAVAAIPCISMPLHQPYPIGGSTLKDEQVPSPNQGIQSHYAHLAYLYPHVPPLPIPSLP